MAELRVIATDKKFQKAPYFLTAKFDEKKKKFETGQDVEWVEEKKDGVLGYKMVESEATKKLSFIINPDESYPLRHLQIFNTDTEADMALLKMFKSHDTILAPSKKAVIPGVHRFYIESKEDEAQIIVSKAEREFEAMSKIKGLTSAEEMKDIARLLKIGKVEKLSKMEVEAILFQKAKEDPNHILAIFTDPNKKAKTYLHKLVEKNVVKYTEGRYTYGDEILGLNELAAIDFLKDKANEKLVKEFSRLLAQEPEVV